MQKSFKKNQKSRGMKETLRNGNISNHLEKLLRKSHQKLFTLAEESQKIIRIATKIADLCSSENFKVKNNVKCSTCWTNFNSKLFLPLLLPCGHTFCKQCLKTLREQKVKSVCPMDQKEFINIENLLPVNFSLMNLTLDPFVTLCSEHNSTILAYCSEDQSLLCGKCLFTHKNHSILPLDSEKIDEILSTKSNFFKKFLDLIRKIGENWEKFLEESLKNSRFLKKLVKNFMKTNQKIDEIEKVARSAQEFLENINHFVSCGNEEVLQNFKFVSQRLEWLLVDFGDLRLTQRLLPKVLDLGKFKSPQLFD
jgi:hypothetical protein